MGLQRFQSSQSRAKIVLHQRCQHPTLATGGQGAPKSVPGAVDQDFEGGVRSQREFRHVVNAKAARIPVKFLGIPVTLESAACLEISLGGRELDGVFSERSPENW